MKRLRALAIVMAGVMALNTSTISAMALETSSMDSAATVVTYAIWRSTELTDDEYGDGRWRWLLYDMDDSAGMVEGRTEADTDSFVSGHWTTDPLGENGDILFSALMENDAFKDRFVSTFLEMADTNFDYDRVHALLYEVAEEYCDAVVASQQRFAGGDSSDGSEQTAAYATDDYWDDIQVIDDFFQERRDYIVEYMYQDLALDCDQ